MDKLGFGIWLRARRKAKGLTQDQLAERSGVSKPYISWLENAKPNTQGVPSQPSKSKVVALAKALSAPLADAMAAAGYSNENSIDSHDLDGVFVSFDSAADLTDEEKSELLQAVRLIAQGIRASKARD